MKLYQFYEYSPRAISAIIGMLFLLLIFDTFSLLKEGTKEGWDIFELVITITTFSYFLIWRFFPKSRVIEKSRAFFKKRARAIAVIAIISLIAIFIVNAVIFFFKYQQLSEEKILSAPAIEYIQKAELELSEAKKYLEENNYQKVQEHIAKASEYGSTATNLEPNNPEIWFRRGNLYWELKGVAGAEEWALKSYEKALELDPENPIYRKKLEALAPH